MATSSSTLDKSCPYIGVGGMGCVGFTFQRLTRFMQIQPRGSYTITRTADGLAIPRLGRMHSLRSALPWHIDDPYVCMPPQPGASMLSETRCWVVESRRG